MTIDTDDVARIRAIRRPHRNLIWSSLAASFGWGPLFPIPMVYKLVRYWTLEYRFDEEGVHMAWGTLFRREITLAYARIQDIHLRSSLIERWLGLARIELQTASGSASAEMTIEGLREFQLVRDYLYQRMRGSRGRAQTQSEDGLAAVVGALRETTEELARLRVALAPEASELQQTAAPPEEQR